MVAYPAPGSRPQKDISALGHDAVMRFALQAADPSMYAVTWSITALRLCMGV